MPLLLGFLGVLGFSGSLPATRVAVEELDASFVGLGRAVVAAALGCCCSCSFASRGLVGTSSGVSRWLPLES